MNAYTANGQARIQQRDIQAVLRVDRMTAAAHLAALERQRGWQADAEVAWLLKQHGIQSESLSSRIAMLRQALGVALVRVGKRLAGGSPLAVKPEPTATAGKLGTAS